MAQEFSEEDVRRSLNETTTNQVRIGETVREGDFYELIQASVIISSVMGMGGCRSLEEFVKMIDETDPQLLGVTLFCISEQLKRMNGVDDKKSKMKRHMEQSVVPPDVKEGGFVPDRPLNTYEHDIGELIVHHGIAPAKIQEIKAKIARGEIKVPTDELSDLKKMTHRDVSNMSKEDFNELLKKMDTYRKQCVNFKLDLSDFNPIGVDYKVKL